MLLTCYIFIWKMGKREARVETKVRLARWMLKLQVMLTLTETLSLESLDSREETRPQHMGKNVSWRAVPLATPILFITHLKSFEGSPVCVLVQPVPRFTQFWPVSLAWFLFPYDISDLVCLLSKLPSPRCRLTTGSCMVRYVCAPPAKAVQYHRDCWEVTALLTLLPSPTLLRTRLYLTTLF